MYILRLRPCKRERRDRITESPVPKGFREKKPVGNVILKKPKRREPKDFLGKPTEDFRVWIREVETYVEYMEATWRDDRDKIQ